jgi:hypothetical protein
MRQGLIHVFAAAITVVLLALGMDQASLAQGASGGQSFSALAVQPGAPPGLTTINIRINITRWSTAEEQQAIMATLLERPSNLVEVLRKMPAVGRLTTAGDVGFELRYAQRTNPAGVEQILVLTDRPVGFGELSSMSRTLDYPVTAIQLRVPPAISGDGQVIVAARLSADRATRQLRIENWDIAPVMLKSVTRER